MNKIKEFFNNKHFSSRQTILISWLVSYIVVLIIPLIGNVVINVHIKNVVKNEMFNSNRMKLEILKVKVDGFFFEGERLSNEIFYNSDVAKLAEANNISGDMRYRARNLGQEIQYHMISSMLNVNGYIYFPKGDYILTNGMLVSSREFYDAYYTDSGLSYSQWVARFKQGGQFVYAVESGYNPDGGEGMVIENIRPIQMIGKGAEETVVLSTAIDSETLFNGVANDGESIIILDKTKNILLGYGDTYETGFFRDIAFNEPGSAVSFKHESEKQVALSIDSDWNEMKYVYTVDESVFNRKISSIWRIIAISLLISFIVGAVIIYFTMNNNYKPVKGLIDMLGKIEKPENCGDTNEYVLIKRVIENLITRNNSNASVLRMNSETLRKVYLLRAVMERNLTEDTEQKLAEVGITFDKEYYCIALIKLEGLGSFSDNVFDDSYNRSLAKYAICNIITELLDRHFVSYTCETNDMIICVINSDGSVESRKKLKQDLTEAQENIGYYLGIMFSVSISGMGNSLEMLNGMYYDALYAAESRGNVGGGEMIDYTEIDEGDSSPDYSYSKWRELCGFIKIGDIASVEGIMDDIIETDFESDSASIQVKKGFACMLISMIMNLASEMGMLNQEVHHKGTECLKELTGEFSVDRLKSGVMDLSNVIYEGMEHDDKNMIAFSDDIIKYIEHHYDDFDLNVTMIGREFGMTASYISKMFLNQTGTKLLDYINMYRVKKAKELLEGASCGKIERIGEMVGFSVNRTFLRTFKKYEGVSPGTYRDTYKNQN